MRKPKTNLEAGTHIQSRIPFTVNSITGSTYAEYGVGWLADDWRNRLYADANALDYVVYSYGTPIAWHTAEGWTVVTQRFSMTTGRHQSIVRGALAAA